MKNTILYFLLFFSLNLFGQKFIVVDKDTYDLVESVSFTIYKDNKVVYQDVTKNNKATIIPEDLQYDKIKFTKTHYRTYTLETQNLNEAVYLSKEHIQLDDLVISTKKEGSIIFGESNRIINSQSKFITSEIDSGIIFKNHHSNLDISQTIFYVDKVKFKTAYKIHFFEVEESLPSGNLQTLHFIKKIYSTDTLYLNPKQKNRIEIEHKEDILFEEGKTLFVCIELLYYLNENHQKFTPTNKDKTKLKFQFSNENNYYAKTYNITKGKESVYLENSNLMVKYDFANFLFKTPSKRILITPAIQLQAKEVKL
ncbi:hypothetical protein ACFSQ0_05645 [Mesonia sediminis]|uniref:Organic solvent tolerance-like N-terminal domain-containing protein n=1 Tax=Mesonia sediminis TaxID=1703946 RepID=A0ABW5SCC0_9FLAO